MSRLKLCMFCGGGPELGKMNREHFVPRNLWSGARPRFTKSHWAHVACNGACSQDDEYFRDVLLSQESIDRHPEARAVVNGPLRRTIERAPRKASKTFKNLGLRAAVTPAGIYVGERPCFDVEWSRMERVLQKVVKGIFCESQKRLVPQDCRIRVGRAQALINAGLCGIFESLGPWVGFGDDVFACRYRRDSRNADMMICLMAFYRFSYFYGLVVPSDVRPFFNGHALPGDGPT